MVSHLRFTFGSFGFLIFIILFISSLGYRPFMMVLQQQVNLLDRFVIKQESIPNFVPSSACKQNALPSQIIVNDNLEQYSKNVSKFIEELIGC